MTLHHTTPTETVLHQSTTKNMQRKAAPSHRTTTNQQTLHYIKVQRKTMQSKAAPSHKTTINQQKLHYIKVKRKTMQRKAAPRHRTTTNQQKPHYNKVQRKTMQRKATSRPIQRVHQAEPASHVAASKHHPPYPKTAPSLQHSQRSVRPHLRFFKLA